MAARRAVARPWSLCILGGSHTGASECAFRTAISLDHAAALGQHALLAFLDCSKSDERVGHALAGERAEQSGMPLALLNLIMSVYSDPRLVRAHGAVAMPAPGNHGLIAGCAFAKDVLKTFLSVATPLHFRDYVDDMALMTAGPTRTLAAKSMHRGVGRARHVLRRDNMMLNDSKAQVFAQFQSTPHAWEDTRGCPTVDAARDLGV